MQNSRRLFAYSPWLALTATLSLAGCGSDGSSDSSGSTQSTAAQTPATAAQTPTSPPPASPLPTATSSNATLSWAAPTENTNGTALTDLRGYRIYYGTSAKELNQVVALSSPGIQTYVVDGLSVGVTYYFAIAAMASDGTESAQSAVVSQNIS
jgi:Fibronectin type III domain